MSGSTVSTPWRRVDTGDVTVGVAERPAIGTTARVAVWPPENLGPALVAVDAVLGALDRQASRFRPDSEISWLHHADGGMFMLSDGLAEAVGVALAAARWTHGMTDPTVGEALVSLGYDRDFGTLAADGRPAEDAGPVPGWRAVRLDGPVLRMPSGVRLDLGATAKGLGSDRAVRAAMSANHQEGGVLVSLGGDIAVDGTPPRDGWPILVAEDPEPTSSGGARAEGEEPASVQEVRLVSGAVATSSTRCRQWRRGGRLLHHIVDPHTGRPTDGPWRTVSVAARTCADANAAATAAVVAGERAEDWLREARVPARLVSRSGGVTLVGGWPEEQGAPVPVPARGHVYAGAGPR